nr:type I restriction endonuclease subunit M [Vibrio sp. MMG023]
MFKYQPKGVHIVNESNVNLTDTKLKEEKYVCTAIPFDLGKIVYTQGVDSMLRNNLGINLAIYIRRHQSGDWGILDIEDKITNDEATKNGERVLSSYIICGRKVWIITERDRSCTTILLPSEY